MAEFKVDEAVRFQGALAHITGIVVSGEDFIWINYIVVLVPLGTPKSVPALKEISKLPAILYKQFVLGILNKQDITKIDLQFLI